jgi:uncharacterized protein YndB with AHSA1/START domain
MKRDLHFEIVYPHPPERVWHALTDPAAIAQWLMPNNFEPRVGHKFHFRTKPRRSWDGVVQCEVLELDRPRRLAYAWNGSGLNTVVTFTLDPMPEGTRLRLDHRGFAGVKGLMLSFILGSGWKSNILRRNLPAVLHHVDDTGFHPPADGTIPGCSHG